MAMGLYQITFCDFIVYTFDGMIIIRTQFDEDYFFSLMQKLNSFYKDFMLPKLVTNLKNCTTQNIFQNFKVASESQKTTHCRIYLKWFLQERYCVITFWQVPYDKFQQALYNDFQWVLYVKNIKKRRFKFSCVFETFVSHSVQ